MIAELGGRKFDSEIRSCTRYYQGLEKVLFAID